MIDYADLADIALFRALPHALLERIVARAADIHANVGEWIVHAGDVAYFWVLLEGAIESVKVAVGETRQLTTFEPGEFFGEVPLMLGALALSGLRAIAPSRLVRIDPIDFHLMITESPAAGALLAQTLVRRVNYIRDDYAAASVTQATIIGTRYDLACHDIRDFLSRNQIAFDWLDPTDSADTGCLPPGVSDRSTFPLVVFSDGRVLECPTPRQIAEGLGLQTQPSSATYDVVIVGGGPAGLAAAVYGGSEGLRTMMVEREAPGGQAGTSSRIENYLGFPGGISGGDLAGRALLQARRFESEILVTRTVEAIRLERDGQVLTLDGGTSVTARALVIATGVSWRKLDARGAEAFVGRGVYYGAARTEALGIRGKDVFLIGGGNSAGQAAVFFSNYARSVTLLVRGALLEKSMSFYLIEQLRAKANVRVETETTVRAVGGGTHLETISTCDERTAQVTERRADGLFVFIGADAQTAWLPPDVQRDRNGFLCTGRDVDGWPLTRAPFALETSVPGIFAAGDVRSTSVKRVASGVGEGSMVIAYIHEYLETLKAPAASY